MEQNPASRKMDERQALDAAKAAFPDWSLWPSQRSSASGGALRSCVCAAPKGGITPLFTEDTVDELVRDIRKAQLRLVWSE